MLLSECHGHLSGESGLCVLDQVVWQKVGPMPTILNSEISQALDLLSFTSYSVWWHGLLDPQLFGTYIVSELVNVLWLASIIKQNLRHQSLLIRSFIKSYMVYFSIFPPTSNRNLLPPCLDLRINMQTALGVGEDLCKYLQEPPTCWCVHSLSLHSMLKRIVATFVSLRPLLTNC